MSDHRDSQGFYRILGVPIDATREEIQLAYERLEEMPESERGISTGRLSRAYSVLIDKACRSSYDQIETAPERPRRTRKKSSALNNPMVLAACIVLLVGILGFVWYPLYGDRIRSFSPGDSLVDLQGVPFGVVVRIDDTHVFPNGVSAPGYLIELSPTKELRWFPADDIKGICRKK